MKARPRKVEREIAELLSLFFSKIDLPKVKRIPTTGRTGPDIEINKMGLIVDVKSRLTCPKTLFPPHGYIWRHETQHVIFTMDSLLNIEDMYVSEVYKWSVQAMRWWSHMNDWKHHHYEDWKIKYGKEHYPDGISAIVMHRPGMPYGNSAMVVSYNGLKKLQKRIDKHKIELIREFI